MAKQTEDVKCQLNRAHQTFTVTMDRTHFNATVCKCVCLCVFVRGAQSQVKNYMNAL